MMTQAWYDLTTIRDLTPKQIRLKEKQSYGCTL
jgi:hypothetical protein